MKLLLDENLPHDFRHSLAGHACFTAAYMGWQGLRNGILLARAAEAAFDAVLTLDAGIEFQQNPTTLPLAVVILRARSNRMPDLKPLVPLLLDALAALAPKTVTWVG
jgi:hypothetical protein